MNFLKGPLPKGANFPGKGPWGRNLAKGGTGAKFTETGQIDKLSRNIREKQEKHLDCLKHTVPDARCY
jgi:hypothetical protein